MAYDPGTLVATGIATKTSFANRTTNNLTDHEERITTNEAGIASNDGDISSHNSRISALEASPAGGNLLALDGLYVNDISVSYRWVNVFNQSINASANLMELAGTHNGYGSSDYIARIRKVSGSWYLFCNYGARQINVNITSNYADLVGFNGRYNAALNPGHLGLQVHVSGSSLQFWVRGVSNHNCGYTSAQIAQYS